MKSAALIAVALLAIARPTMAPSTMAPSTMAPSTMARLQAQTPPAAPMEVQDTPSVLLPGLYFDSERAPLKVGTQAPDFSLPLCRYSARSKSGQTLDFARWRTGQKSRGTVVIFWAFWCDTWKDVTRHLNVLRPQLKAMNLKVLCIAVDASQQPVARRAFEKGDI